MLIHALIQLTLSSSKQTSDVSPAAQIAMATNLTPPEPGEPSYESNRKERMDEVASLRRRAHMVTDAFNALEGVTCNFTEGAMYSFPQVCFLRGCAVG